MKIIVNKKNVLVSGIEVEINSSELTRQFTIRNIENKQSFLMGDKVEIYNNLDKLLIKGTIECLEVDQENNYTYAGRNYAKYIVDCYADKTIQFSKDVTVQSILEEVVSKFNLKIKGSAKMPKETIVTILAGDNFGEFFKKIAKLNSQFLSSDAVGNIEIENEAMVGSNVFTYGNNIRNRNLTVNKTYEYDKYIVFSQSNFINDTKQEMNIQGVYGKGKRVKVIIAQYNLNSEECKKLAEQEYIKDRRKSFEYIVELDSDVDIEVNKKYKVTDESAKINGMLKVKKCEYVFNKYSDKIIVSFEGEQNE